MRHYQSRRHHSKQGVLAGLCARSLFHRLENMLLKGVDCSGKVLSKTKAFGGAEWINTEGA